jgi:TonB-linked SusC/RagA family outer membrane protein
MNRIALAFLMLCFAVGSALSQRTITGRVTDDKGEPMIGATVVVKGASIGTTTNTSGTYTVSILPENTALVFSYTGFVSKEVAIDPNSNVLDVVLSENAEAIQEVVVTALGIKRDKKALGYASTVVSAQEIAEKPETDVARALIGRAPGVVITNSSGLAGSGTKINIRGTSTITGNSQPLWVVDGVPVNTSANESNDPNSFNDGNITPTRNLDIDPNNIQNISILRGLSATTLYGSQGRNGVILVTTKTGAGSRKRFTASVSQSYFLTEAVVPEYQNKWGNGFDGDYGEFFSNWGSILDGTRPRNAPRHPYWEHRNLFPEYPEFQQAAGAAGDANPYIPTAYPNNVKDFFQTGNSLTTSVNAGVSGDVGSFNVSFGRTGEEGYIANNELERYNFTIGGIANLSSKISVTGNFTFVNTDFETPTVGAGLGSNSNGGPSVFANLFYTPRNIDLMNWPYANPVTGTPVYYRNGGDITNPRWLLENSQQASYVDRFMSVMSANYSILPWMKLTYRIGLDNYNEDQNYYVNRGAAGFPTTPTDLSAFSTGLYRTTAGRNTIVDQSFILSGAKNITEDLDFTANIGYNDRKDTYEQQGLESTNQVVFGVLEHRNFINNNDRDLRNNPLNFYARRIIVGVFGDVTFGYRNYLYLNLQGRNDWASSHEKDFRSQFYPGVSLSFIPTQAFAGMESSTLNFLKLRLGYGTSANFAPPYNTRPYLTLNANAAVDGNGNVISSSLPNLLANPDLRPELQKEFEIGFDLKMFSNRFGVDFSYYDRTAKDQIIARPLDPSTGFDETFINAGTISNKGVEIGITITPVRTKDFTWNLRANFTKNKSLVEDLPEGSEEIPISGFSNLGNFAIEGQPYGVIQGTYAVRNGADGRTGDFLITENGDYKISNEIGIIGDPNPDYMLSGFTDFSWKGITIGGQLDFVKGGQIFSYSAATLVGRGVAKELEDFNPELTVILPGVSEETGEPNNIPMPASGVFFGNTIIGGGPDDRGIFDATRVRLREVYLTYDIPKRVFGNNSFIEGMTIALIGNNLWFRAVNTPEYSKVDPDRTAFGTNNGYGFDFLGGPSARRYGVNVKVNF